MPGSAKRGTVGGYRAAQTVAEGRAHYARAQMKLWELEWEAWKAKAEKWREEADRLEPGSPGGSRDGSERLSPGEVTKSRVKKRK